MRDRAHTTSPGWYPDPSGVDQQRYWDGADWTDHVTPRSQAPKAPKKQRTWLHVMFGVMLALILLVGGCVTLIAVAANSDDTKTVLDASGDVTDLRIEPIDQFGFVKGTVTVVNHSSKRSDYFIEVALQSGDGSVQQESTSAFVANVEPNQTATNQIVFHPASPTPDAKAVVKSVRRTASR